MAMICLRIKLHTPSSNASLVIPIKAKPKCGFLVTVIMFWFAILQRMKMPGRVAYVLKIYYNAKF